MKRLFIGFLGVFTFSFVSSLAFAEGGEFDHKKWAERALDKIKSPINEGWSFDLESRDGKNINIERYDASKPEGERWTLVRVKGKNPKKKDISKYRKRKAEELERRKERLAEAAAKDDTVDESAEGNAKENGEVNAGIDRDSIEFSREESEDYVYSFAPEIDEDINPHVRGEMRVSKTEPIIKSLEMFSIEKFSKGPAKIKEARFHIEFTAVNENMVFLSKNAVMLDGKAYLLVSIDQDSEQTYSNFSKAVLSD